MSRGGHKDFSIRLGIGQRILESEQDFHRAIQYKGEDKGQPIAAIGGFHPAVVAENGTLT